MRGLIRSCLILACVGIAQSQSTLPSKNYTLDLTNGPVSLDGFTRNAVLVNGTTPGPILNATKGQDMFIKVNNKLTDRSMRISTSIHWHGIFQPMTAYDDGPAFVTQCPIAPNNSYLYKVKTGTQAGTFWYHSHLSSQYVDGLRGALIIRDPTDVHRNEYEWDNDTTVIGLTDWYHNASQQLGHDWLSGGGNVREPVPDSALLNGLGRYNNNTLAPRAVVNVQKGQRYRFRIINMSATLTFNFGIEGHNLTVIEVDGVSHRSHGVTSLSIAAGQRYSVILNANNVIDNYWIAYAAIPAFAILRYQDAKEVDPKSQLPFVPDDSKALQEHELVPFVDEHIPTEPHMLVPLDFAFDGKKVRYTINNITYNPPTVPTLLEILTNPNKTNQASFVDEDVYYLPRNTTIDLRIKGFPNHPFHLHGHAFQVIQSAKGPRNEKNPPIRDTVNSNGGTDTSDPGPVTIRFRTDNPGPWFFHCHKDWHLEAGLAAVFAEDPAGMRKEITPDPAWRALCDIYNKLDPKDKL